MTDKRRDSERQKKKWIREAMRERTETHKMRRGDSRE